MKMTNQNFIEKMLYSLKLENNELEIQQRINIAVYKAKQEIIEKQIDCFEHQLQDIKEGEQ